MTTPDHLAPYINSVFQVTAVSKIYDYSHPWDPPSFGSSWRGSSFALEYQGKKMVVTNAHVSGDSAQLSVRFSNDCKPYPAKVFSISHVSDLALLEIKDPKFWEKAQCLQIGEMPDVQEEVKVVGFPKGGNELCVTSGKVNRIEVEKYEQGGVDLLNYQFDAAQTNGNSGGPVFYKDKVMGVAFQGLVDCDTSNYAIPAVVLEHFLHDTFYYNHGGFPDLNIKWQCMTNENLRKYYNMKESDSGVLVTKIDPLSDVNDVLEKDDIILYIDGYSVSNDGKVDLGRPLRNRIDFSYLVNMKFIGDSISLRVLRRGIEYEFYTTLTKRHRDTKKVGIKEYDKPADYFINSYLAFTPMTENYLEDVLGELGVAMKSEKAKEIEGDQHILLSHVFPHEDTYSYEKFTNSYIKRVNDEEINNMQQLIHHFDTWSGSFVKVELKDGEIIVVPHLSKRENDSFLKKFQIRHDRSPNFRTSKEEPETPEMFDPKIYGALLLQRLLGGLGNDFQKGDLSEYSGASEEESEDDEEDYDEESEEESVVVGPQKRSRDSDGDYPHPSAKRVPGLLP